MAHGPRRASGVARVGLMAHGTYPAPVALAPGHSPRAQETTMPRSSFTSRSLARRQSVLAERACVMRRAPTTSEARLIHALRAGTLGIAFRTQVPLLGRFIADLLIPEVRLVVEVDGLYHTRRTAADARRDRALARAGYCVLRLDAELVMLDLDAAVACVVAEVERLR
jgi:very-short-patch-repair endonuclease